MILTRNEVIDLLDEIKVVPVTRRIRGLTTEGILTQDDGMPVECALNFDHVALAQREPVGSVLCNLEIFGRFFFRFTFAIIPFMPQHKSAKTIQASNIEGGAANLHYFDTPDICSRCFVNLVPRFVTATFGGQPNEPGSFLQIVFQCTQDNCQEVFIATYLYTHDTRRAPNQRYEFDNLAPKNPPKASCPSSVADVSPDFISIYNQAIAAEAADLDQIAGIGLRKALEFLIKDFSINQHPTKTAEIKSTNLGACITNYCDDARLQTVASRAVWLGNDETHYTRKWITNDINDLKTLIKLSVNWMENVLLTQQYAKEIDPANPPEILDTAPSSTQDENTSS